MREKKIKRSSNYDYRKHLQSRLHAPQTRISAVAERPRDACAIEYFAKGVFIAIQLNSTRRRVVDTFTS